MRSPESGILVVTDRGKCSGCLCCMLACSLVHEGEENLSLSRIQISQDRFEGYPGDIENKVTDECDLCLNAPYWSEKGGRDGKQACIEVCPMKALKLKYDISSAGDEVN